MVMVLDCGRFSSAKIYLEVRHSRAVTARAAGADGKEVPTREVGRHVHVRPAPTEKKCRRVSGPSFCGRFDTPIPVHRRRGDPRRDS